MWTRRSGGGGGGRRSSFRDNVDVCLFHICHGPNFTNLRIKSLLNPLIVPCWNDGDGDFKFGRGVATSQWRIEW